MIVLVVLLFAFSAAAEQKNVKLLTGLSDLQMQRTMNMIRASMGTHCDYCHVMSANKEVDFASDEKPAKARAREMIKMVMEINKSTFGGNPTVSCFTCHRGSPRPVRFASLPQTAPPFPTPKPEVPQLPAARDLVAKYAAALGDGSRLSLPRVVKGSRTGWQGTPAPFEFAENGPVPPADERVRAMSVAFAPVAPSEISENARTTRKETISDRDAWVVADGNRRFYFDAASGLVVRAVLLTPTAIGQVPQQTDYEDYRDTGGVKFPFRIRASLVDPWVSASREYESVQIGEPK